MDEAFTSFPKRSHSLPVQSSSRYAPRTSRPMVHPNASQGHGASALPAAATAASAPERVRETRHTLIILLFWGSQDLL